MKNLVKYTIVNALSLWIIDSMSESIAFNGAMPLVITALALALLNATVKPILKAISLPVTVLTLGLFSLVINGAVLWMAFAMSNGSYISSFGSAIWIALVLAVLNGLIGPVLGKDD
jgi:putative membrane protein